MDRLLHPLQHHRKGSHTNGSRAGSEGSDDEDDTSSVAGEHPHERRGSRLKRFLLGGSKHKHHGESSDSPGDSTGTAGDQQPHAQGFLVEPPEQTQRVAANHDDQPAGGPGKSHPLPPLPRAPVNGSPKPPTSRSPASPVRGRSPPSASTGDSRQEGRDAAHVVSPPRTSNLKIDSRPRSLSPGVGYLNIADLALVGVAGDPEASMHTLRERGFVIHLALQRPNDFVDYALGIGPKLLTKLAIQNAVVRGKDGFSRIQRACLAVEAINIIARSPLSYKECFLLHQPGAMALMAEGKMDPNDINAYFGSGVSMYFAWLQYYTHFLRYPAAVGLLLFIMEHVRGGTDIQGAPIFCVFISIWSTLFLECWKRRNAELALLWNVEKVEEERVIQDLAKKAGKPRPTTLGKYSITIPAILTAIFLTIRAMLYCINLSDHAVEKYGTGYMRYWPTLLYSVVPLVCSVVYQILAERLNDFEGHETSSDKNDSLTLKLFAFHFVNYFCALFYISFYLRDMDRLTGMLFSLTVTKQITGNIQEIGLPMLSRWYKEWKTKKVMSEEFAKRTAEESKKVAEEVKTSAANTPTKTSPSKSPAIKTSPAKVTLVTPTSATEAGVLVGNVAVISPAEFEEQLIADPFVSADEYLEMVVQFGFCTMFAVAFPLAPLMAYANNVFEYKLDTNKLLHSRRPNPTFVSNIGSWFVCLRIMGIVATLTNSFIIFFMHESVGFFVPTALSPLLESTQGKVILAVMLEHILLLFKNIVAGVVPDSPLWVRETQALRVVEEREREQRGRLAAHGIPDSPTALRSLNPIQHLDSQQQHEAEDRKKSQTRLTKLQISSGRWSFGPHWYLLLVIIPYSIIYLGLSSLWVLPLAVLVISYMQHSKDRSDKAFAMGVVQDVKVLKLIKEDLPAWFYDGEAERVEWVNNIVARLWPHITGALQVIVKETVEPMIDQYRPKGVTRLGFKRVSLGPKPFTVSSIKFMRAREDAVVFDVEVKWSGQPIFIVEVGRKVLPLTLSLRDIQFSGILRVELAPLVPLVPCFGALAVTFMQRPFIDFSFKVAGLDIMSIGPGDLSIANVVANTIKSVIEDMMLYPGKMVFPVLPDVDVAALASTAPHGVLQLKVVGCDKLRNADTVGKSDPYVVIRCGEEHMKTRVIDNNLNPRWNQLFDILIYDKESQNITFHVFDEDVDFDDPLGNCELSLSGLPSLRITSLNIPLCDTTTGSLLLNCHYIPLRKEHEKPKDPDVLYMETHVTDEQIAEEEEALYPQDGSTRFLAGDESSHHKGSKFGMFGKIATLGLRGKPTKEPKPIDQEEKEGLDEGVPASVDAANLQNMGMGVLTISKISVEDVSPQRLYCILRYGNQERLTETLPKDATDLCWTQPLHLLIRADLKHVTFDVIVMHPRTIAGQDKEIGRKKLSLMEIINNNNVIEQEWGMSGEKVTGRIAFKAMWRGAQTSPSAINNMDAL